VTDRVWPQVNTPYQTKDVAGLSMSSTKVAPTAADIFGTLAVSGPVVAGTKIEVISQAGSEEDLFAAFAGGKMQPTTRAHLYCVAWALCSLGSITYQLHVDMIFLYY
jgi:hypothetical protein